MDFDNITKEQLLQELVDIHDNPLRIEIIMNSANNTEKSVLSMLKFDPNLTYGERLRYAEAVFTVIREMDESFVDLFSKTNLKIICGTEAYRDGEIRNISSYYTELHAIIDNSQNPRTIAHEFGHAFDALLAHISRNNTNKILDINKFLSNQKNAHELFAIHKEGGASLNSLAWFKRVWLEANEIELRSEWFADNFAASLGFIRTNEEIPFGMYPPEKCREIFQKNAPLADEFFKELQNIVPALHRLLHNNYHQISMVR